MNEVTIVEKAIEIILKCSDEDLQALTNTEIAKRIAVAPRVLNRRFKRGLGMSLPDFILREKIHRAYSFLMEDSGISIAGLSKKLGFSKVSDLDNAFENHFAIDPGKFSAIRRGVY